MPAVGSNVGYKMCVTSFSLLTVCSDVVHVLALDSTGHVHVACLTLFCLLGAF